MMEVLCIMCVITFGQTTELAIADMGKYYMAMDKAIMNYHAQKMKEINTIIRELWRNTYRGKGNNEHFQFCNEED